MARIKVIKQAILVCRGAGVTPFVWGHRGMGKSSLVDRRRGAGMGVRGSPSCSQLEAADLRGLPHRGDAAAPISCPRPTCLSAT